MENNLGSLLLEAANLLVVGMGGVFLFLGILILFIKIMSYFFAGEIPAPAKVNVPNRTSTKAAGIHQDKKVVAAISAAVHQYRRDNKQ